MIMKINRCFERAFIALTAIVGYPFVSYSATECVWIGGDSGDVFVESNWSPAHVPSSPNITAYIAVFTNSVELTSSSYWYPAGFTVSNSAKVVMKGSRCYPSAACEDNAFPVMVEEGSSFTFDGTIFYGSSSFELVKKGGGEFCPRWWCGNSNSNGAYWKSLDVQGGTFKFSPTANFTCIGEYVRIGSGAIGIIQVDTPFACSAEKGLSQPKIIVEDGGVFDMNGKTATISALSGSGIVTNCSKTLTMNLKDSDEVFSGKVAGGGILAVVKDDSWTAENAKWIVGSQNALWGVALNRENAGDCEVRFASGIGMFFAGGVPEDAPCLDTDGVPVEIVHSGKYWYVDAERQGEGGDGKTLASAFRTLKEAMTNDKLAAYDTVFVAPGIYSNETMDIQLSDTTVKCRVEVPENVRLVSLGSATNTFIDGETSSVSIENGYGMGPDAVRCVRLNAGSQLRGFTVRGGRVTAATTSSQGEICYGGGVFAEESSVVIGCVISNCVATRGGGAYRGNYFNCRFASNRATGSAMVGSHLMGRAKLYNCVLTDGLGSCDWYANATDSLALNCTFAPNDKGSIRGTGAASGAHVCVQNCVVLSAPPSGAYDEYHASAISPRGSVGGVTFDDFCIVTNLTAATDPTANWFFRLDSSLRPRFSSRLLGAADIAAYRTIFPAAQYWLSVYDADGARRIWGDALDIGAFSFDRNSRNSGTVISVR